MIRIVEVGPRDGLQNEKTPVATEMKADFIRALIDAGLREIEATSFVSPKWVPQLGDAADLWPQLPVGPLYSALVPNEKGLDRALQLGVSRIAVFTAASDAFTKKNINMTVEESIEAFRQVVDRFRAERPDGWVRAYVSTAVECPYSGPVDPAVTVGVASTLEAMGVDEISIGDTIGVAAPKEVRELTLRLLDRIPKEKLAYHFHDTRGTAIANVEAALRQGITTFDAAAGGLGGC
ncbi:MAG TPA: hydroxymethylglutaryl-CoA lyase, partial [Fimbriimonadaceae bacterium]|nr:hydroxymethylglutaryl-CoA lyase [Fimbriimonadaceae bacterium]